MRNDGELGSIPNVIAFNDLLCDFEVSIDCEARIDSEVILMLGSY